MKKVLANITLTFRIYHESELWNKNEDIIHVAHNIGEDVELKLTDKHSKASYKIERIKEIVNES